MTEKFLVDANSFIEPYRRYYAFDLIPSYWEALSAKAKTGRVVLLDMVKDEIDKGEDALADRGGICVWVHHCHNRSGIRWAESKDAK